MLKISVRGIAIAALFAPLFCFAGDGNIDEGAAGGVHKMNLKVAFLYEEAAPDDWKPLFEKASELLFDATEKQVQFGKISVYNNCASLQSKADIHILDDTSGARAHPGGLGKANQHLWLSQTHKSTSGAAIGQFGLVHELGHYAFKLYDEYKGKILASADAPAGTPNQAPVDTFFCNDDTGAGAASIMDGGTKVSPNNSKTEFCTDPADGFATSHESGYVNGADYILNDQQDRNGESSWETLVRYSNSQYGLTINAPSVEPVSNTAGHSAIDWQLESCDTRAVITIDRSGSMQGASIALAKQAGKLFVDLGDVGEQIGVTSFASSAGVNFILQDIVSDATKNSARAAIDPISASGSTNIGGGLQTSLNQITAAPVEERSENEVIILLSDGQHNSGTAPASVLPSIISEKVTVHTIGLGGGADLPLLQDIASQTGGVFRFAASAADLAPIFTQLSAEARGEGVLSESQGILLGAVPFETEVFVDDFVNSVSVVVNWDAGTLALQLESPSGQVIESQGSLPTGVTATSGQGYKILTIQSPEVGSWKVQLRGDTTISSQSYNAVVLGAGVGVEFNLTSTKNRFVYPEPIIISALVQAKHAVDGADVSGVITRPDGTVADFNLFDDGNPAHGDEVASDGIYSNRLSSFAGDGVYAFKLRAENRNGFAIQPDTFEEDPDNQPIPIAPFTREDQLAIIIENAPDFIVATLEIGPEVINLKSQGKWVTCYVELPTEWDVRSIALESVRITEINGQPIASIFAETRPSSVGDVDNDLVEDMMVKFDRGALQSLLDEGESQITIQGLVAGQEFIGERVVKVIAPGKKTF